MGTFDSSSRWDDALRLRQRAEVAEAKLFKVEMTAELCGEAYLKVTRQPDGSLAYETLGRSEVAAASAKDAMGELFGGQI
jgi:hypothetical protein